MSQSLTNKKNILIVEDNAPSMILALALIKRIIPNSNISKAFDGKSALDLINSEKFDLIFLDLILPDINGLLIAENIRTNPNHPNNKTPIIALTANILPILREQSVKAGINDFILKPTNETTLRQTIEKYLDITPQ